jgi:proteasome lid subunit RPN8/RPN11
MGKKKKMAVADSIESLFSLDTPEDFDENLPNAPPGSNQGIENLINISPNQPNISKNSSNIRLIPTSITAPEGYIQCPPAIPIIPITQKAFDDMIMMAKAVNEISHEKWGEQSEKMEIYCYVLADPTEIKPGQPARISEIFIPRHKATETSVEVAIEQLKDIQSYIRETGKMVLGWSHSHGHFDVYSSSTDERNHQLLLNETQNILSINQFQLKYAYGITVVESGEKFGIVLTQYPCGHIQRMEAEFMIEGDPYTEAEAQSRFEEIKELVRDRVDLQQPSQQQSSNDMMTDLSAELLQDFVRNLWKAKNMVIENLAEDIDFNLVQKIIKDYDAKILAGAEETFNKISEKLMGVVKQFQKEI